MSLLLVEHPKRAREPCAFAISPLAVLRVPLLLLYGLNTDYPMCHRLIPRAQCWPGGVSRALALQGRLHRAGAPGQGRVRRCLSGMHITRLLTPVSFLGEVIYYKNIVRGERTLLIPCKLYPVAHRFLP